MMSGTATEFQQVATRVRTVIRHRRCLLCGRFGDDHRIVVSDDLHVAIVSEDRQHRYDPGERRIGLPR